MSALDQLLLGIKRIYGNGVAAAPASGVNFLGAGVTTAFNSDLNTTDVTIPGSGSAPAPVVQDVSAGGTIPSSASRGVGVISLTGSPAAGFTYTLPTGGQGTYQISNVSTEPATVGPFTLAAGATETFWTDGSTVAIVPQTSVSPVAHKGLSWTGTAWVPQYGSGPVYNAVDSGFDPTGATPCDTACDALRALIVAQGVAGTIVFPPGTYRFDAPVAAFPTSCVFEGRDWAINTILSYTGTGSFIRTASYQQYRNLTIRSSHTDAYTGNPGRQNIILTATNTNPIVYTTATSHGYANGDQLGIYGITGNTAANNGPDTVDTITVTGSNSFSVARAGNGAYTPSTVSVSGASNAANIVVSTSAPHGLKYGQLVYISGVTGNIAANGLHRVSAVPTVATQFQINVAGNGTYGGGGTVTSGGVSVEYSGQALVGLNTSTITGGNVGVFGCVFDGFKYAISVDGGEACWFEQCYFSAQGAGYSYDAQTNDSTHSCVCVRIGAFETSPNAGYANGVWFSKCSFAATYAGSLNNDGYTHNFTDCSYENGVLAIVVGAIGVRFTGCGNDGSGDADGVIQVKSDGLTTGAIGQMIYVDGGTYSSSAGSLVAVTNGVLVGVKLSSVFWSAGNLSIIAGNISSPMSIDGCVTMAGQMTTNSVGLRNQTGTATGATSGETVNHFSHPQAALDIGFFPYYGLSPAKWSAILARNPQQPNTVFIDENWTTAYAYTGGSRQSIRQVLSSANLTAGSRQVTGAGWVNLPATAAAATVAPTDVPLTYCSGTIVMTAQAEQNGVSSNRAFWRVRQRFYKNGGAPVLGAIEEYEVHDDIGLVPPTMAFAGTTPANVIQATVASSATVNVEYSVTFEISQVGA